MTGTKYSLSPSRVTHMLCASLTQSAGNNVLILLTQMYKYILVVGSDHAHEENVILQMIRKRDIYSPEYS